MILYRRLIFSILTVVSLLGVVGCQALSQDEPLTEVVIQLKWVHQAQFAGFYVADQQGFYAEEGLDVVLLPGGVGVDAYDVILSGAADFGVVGAESVLSQRVNDQPVVAIATTYRINPYVMVAFEDSGIRGPADFEGRKVIVSDFDTIQFYAMIEQFGLNESDMTVISYGDSSNQMFYDGEVDVIASFVAGSLIPLEDGISNRDIRLIWPGDYGVSFYSDTIVTTETLLADNPDLVLRFLKATLKGHQTAIENPSIGVESTMVYAEIQDEAIQTKMLIESIPLIHTGEDAIGWMDPAVWQAMHDIMLDQAALPTPVDLESAYDLSFLAEIYGEAP